MQLSFPFESVLCLSTVHPKYPRYSICIYSLPDSPWWLAVGTTMESELFSILTRVATGSQTFRWITKQDIPSEPVASKAPEKVGSVGVVGFHCGRGGTLLHCLPPIPDLRP